MDDNPYQAPASPIGREAEDLFGTPGVAPSAERDLRVFVRRNPDYYLKKWAPALVSGGGTGFNWAAFLFTGFWVPYRKMYKVAFVLYGFFLIEEVVELAIAGLAPGSERALGLAGNLVTLVVSIVVGKCGNGWYLAHAQGAIAEVRSRGLPDGEAAKELARRGGTNLLAAFGLMLSLLALIFAAGFVSELLTGGE